jgi:hypothetical protein
MPLHKEVAPEIVPGAAGAAVAATTRVRTTDAPHELFAVTEMVPPEVPVVTVMLLAVLVPDQPAGSVQVYVVAPATAGTE